MTETLTDPPPVPPPPPPVDRRLARDPDDQVVAGVCAAFGRYTDTDPVLWRVTVAVLALFGGAGLALYVLGWALIPRTGQESSAVERRLRRPDRSVSPLGVVLVVLTAVVLLALLDDGPGVGALVVLGGLAYLVARDRRTSPPTAVPATAPTGSAVAYGPSTYGPSTYGPSTWSDGGAATAPPTPRGPRERSVLGPLTLSAAALVAGLLLALRAGGVDGLTAPRVLAAALLVVGAGLLVGTSWGRARWLIAVGLLLTAALAVSAAVERADLRGGFGERTWVATGGDAAHELGVGHGVVDLRELADGERASVDAEVGVGQLTVLVPEDMTVDVVADVGLGDVLVREADGRRTDVLGTGSDDTDLHEEFTVGGPADGTVQLDLEVGMGEIEVRRVAP